MKKTEVLVSISYQLIKRSTELQSDKSTTKLQNSWIEFLERSDQLIGFSISKKKVFSEFCPSLATKIHLGPHFGHQVSFRATQRQARVPRGKWPFHTQSMQHVPWGTKHEVERLVVPSQLSNFVFLWLLLFVFSLKILLRWLKKVLYLMAYVSDKYFIWWFKSEFHELKSKWKWVQKYETCTNVIW